MALQHDVQEDEIDPYDRRSRRYQEQLEQEQRAERRIMHAKRVSLAFDILQNDTGNCPAIVLGRMILFFGDNLLVLIRAFLTMTASTC